jgi:hypothetical protein
MSPRSFDQPPKHCVPVGRRLRGVHVMLVAMVVNVAACQPSTPHSTVNDLNWACGDRRCSVTFRLDNDGEDEEALAVRVRAYSGSSVQSRKAVGEHTERIVLKSRGIKRYTIGVDTSTRAEQVRVLLEFDRR